jgi:Holliday junction DNA helicase RuvB
VRDYAEVKGDGVINRAISISALNLLEIDELGLDDMDRRVLLTILEKYQGGPVGLSTIAASISDEPDTIMDVVEPYLLQLGFIERTSQGRVATKIAYKHFNIPYPEKGQPKLL